jgi:hypothetical protein
MSIECVQNEALSGFQSFQCYRQKSHFVSSFPSRNFVLNFEEISNSFHFFLPSSLFPLFVISFVSIILLICFVFSFVFSYTNYFTLFQF